MAYIPIGQAKIKSINLRTKTGGYIPINLKAPVKASVTTKAVHTPIGKPKLNTLSPVVGGGAYFGTMADKVNEGRSTYGGFPTKIGFERNDIVPVFAGGANSSPKNIEYLKSGTPFQRLLGTPVQKISPDKRQVRFDEGRVAKEQEISRLYSAGKISRADAITAIKRFDFEQELKSTADQDYRKQYDKNLGTAAKGGLGLFTKAIPAAARKAGQFGEALQESTQFTGGLIGDVARFLPRAIAKTAISGSPTQREAIPRPGVQQFILGKDPIKPVSASILDAQKSIKEKLQSKGIDAGIATGISLAVSPIFFAGMTAADLTPFAGLRKTTFTKIAALKEIPAIVSELKTIFKNVGDNELEQLAIQLKNITNPVEVEKIVETLAKRSTVQPSPASQAVAKELVTSPKETPIEFGLGKKSIQERRFAFQAQPLFAKLEKAKLTREDSVELFNAMDNPSAYVVSGELKARGGDTFINEAKSLNRIISKEKLDNEIIERAWDDNVYLRTVFEQLDGSEPTSEQIVSLKNAASETFREQLVTSTRTGVGKLKEKLPTLIRKFANADLRDDYIKEFGLRTKRDFVNSINENIRISNQVLANKKFNDAIRDIARRGMYNQDGTLLKRADIFEAYNPQNVKQTVTDINLEMKKGIEVIVENLRSQKVLINDEANLIKAGIRQETRKNITELKDIKQYALDDIDNLKEYLRGQLALVGSRFRQDKLNLVGTAQSKIDDLREQAAKKINDYFGSITIKRAANIDKGFRDLGDIRGAEPLRGIMVGKRDFEAMSELIKEVKPSSLEDFARTMKLVQATLDLFQLPQALRSSISVGGGLKGSSQWLKAVSNSSGVTTKEIIDSSEFVQLGRWKDFDIDIWNKTLKSNPERDSDLLTMLKKINTATDVSGIREVKDVMGSIVGGLEKYQWQTVMIPLKAMSWKKKVEEMVRLYPGVDERTIKVQAGRFVDDYFGGQNWDKLMVRNPKALSRSVQRSARIIMFAPDYLMSKLRVLKRETIDASMKWGNPEGSIARKAVIRKLVYGLGLAQAISYKINGHSTFENDDPNQFYKIQLPILDQKGNPYYFDIMGNWGQTYNLINRPIPAISGGLSGPARVIISALNGEGISLKVLGESLNPIPFSWRNIATYIKNLFVPDDKAKHGMPTSFAYTALLSGLEMLGGSGTFSGGKSKTQTLAKMIRNGNVDMVSFWEWITGTTENSSVIKKKAERLYERIQKLVSQGKIAEATAILQAMTPEEYAEYKKLKAADKTKAAEPSYKRIQELMSQGKIAEATAITEAMTPAEYAEYKKLKKKDAK